ncbi:prepilin-type N-terminal cleavage/methylation domain-containing protein, partial [Meiothermus luteus]|uniref:prepilin-type N-terminal cleavage/methylation domain-containing protein n=1 Tax=Meiothermus luteus TaxID=2026184 RepID=UPI00319E4619
AVRGPKGLSLLELVVVVAVLGVLLGVGFVSLQSYRQNLAIREAALQVATELMNIRQQARRLSLDHVFEARQGGSTYQVGPAGALMERSLPAGVVFQRVPAGGRVTFYAPYGRVSAANSTYELQGPGARVLQVNIVGSTGKVVVRAP